MSHYSDPQHALLHKIAQGIEELNKTLQDAPQREATLLATTLAENVRLKEEVQRLGEELLLVRMDATQDPVLRAAFEDAFKNPRLP